MIATEAAAEGINLQFCSLVVNYDMPWNPQRIEQRIGRCHRYGQKFDVVVINFLNKQNAADVRVYELLDQKFQLFSGVFGASDEVLGAIGNGVDFEKRIALIYQQCRTPMEIKAAFDALQEELQEQISDKMLKARSTLLENFDESVAEKLRSDLEEAKGNLDRYETVLWNLARYSFGDRCHFDETDRSFFIDRVDCYPLPTKDVRIFGRHILIPSKDKHKPLPADAIPFRRGSLLAQSMLDTLMDSSVEPIEVTLDYTHAPFKVALVSKLVGASGWMTVDKLTIDSFEREDFFLYGCVTDKGKPVFADIAEKILNLACVGSQPLGVELSEPTTVLLADQITAQRTEITTANAARNNTFFEEEMAKLDNWAEDVKTGLERELRDLDAEIKLRKSESKKLSRLEDKVGLQRQIKDLEKNVVKSASISTTPKTKWMPARKPYLPK